MIAHTVKQRSSRETFDDQIDDQIECIEGVGGTEQNEWGAG